MSQADLYDVIIIGGGPAGLAAALYAARDRYKTLVLEKNGMPGGQIMLTEHIENYPGYVKVGGFELVEKQKEQVLTFGAEVVVNKGVEKLEKLENGTFRVSIRGEDSAYETKAVILAPGSDYRQLGVPGEQELRQAGKVSYCATCDGAFYRDKHVLAVGGGNTAVEDSVYLATRFCRKITHIHRRTEFRAQQVLVEELYETAKEKDIDVKLPYVLEEIVGNEDNTEIDHVKIKNVDTGRVEQLEVDGVFVFVGMIPNTNWLDGTVDRDENGYILADPVTMKTSTPGIFVAGDCRQEAAMQLATATADGVIAAMMLKEYYRNPESWGVPLGKKTEKSGW
ncbi:MAG: NAD(P)/FAD-dependent oxidoreductase [Phycisphaerae bacterium]